MHADAEGQLRGLHFPPCDTMSWLLHTPVLGLWSYHVCFTWVLGIQSGPHKVPITISSAHFPGVLTYYYYSSFCQLREGPVTT